MSPPRQEKRTAFGEGFGKMQTIAVWGHSGLMLWGVGTWPHSLDATACAAVAPIDQICNWKDFPFNTGYTSWTTFAENGFHSWNVFKVVIAMHSKGRPGVVDLVPILSKQFQDGRTCAKTQLSKTLKSFDAWEYPGNLRTSPHFVHFWSPV